jgi:hypothetical protein
MASVFRIIVHEKTMAVRKFPANKWKNTSG